MNVTNPKSFSGFKKLNDYLDLHPEDDIFSSDVGGMIIEGLSDIEFKGTTAVAASTKHGFREEFGKDVVTDVFRQGIALIQQASLVRGVFAAESIIKDNDINHELRAFIAEVFLVVLDREENLCKLMSSIIHTMKDDESSQS